MFREALRYIVISVCAVMLCFSSVSAASHADFRADVVYSDAGSTARTCGWAMTSGDYARLDIELGRAGGFSLVVDMEHRVLRVLSQRLKAYVETAIPGNAGNWRDIVRGGAAVLMPQTLGMVSLEEIERHDLGQEAVQGYAARKSRNVFRLGFLGSYRDITVYVWESDIFVPFPLKVEVAEGRDTRKGSAWMTDITASKESRETFLVPEGFTRYTSVMDLILYALSAF